MLRAWGGAGIFGRGRKGGNNTVNKVTHFVLVLSHFALLHEEVLCVSIVELAKPVCDFAHVEAKKTGHLRPRVTTKRHQMSQHAGNVYTYVASKLTTVFWLGSLRPGIFLGPGESGPDG